MRYLTDCLKQDLQKKLVFLAGPRQVGKSTVAKGLIASPNCYLNWDIGTHRKIIRELEWPKDQGIVVLDELHNYPKWKGLLKGVIDEFNNKPPILVTGSARLETFRKGGDALTGRTYLYRLHPIDPLEACSHFSESSLLSASTRLLQTGGFPEAFLNTKEADRLREDRLQIVVREDLRDLSNISELRGMQLLVDLLRERVGGVVNYSNLAADIGVSSPTIKKWVELLERLYVIFLVYPFSRNLARTIRREPKVFFFDCAAGTNGEGARFENLIAGTLLKYLQFENDHSGRRFNLHYYRDKDGREVDFVVTNGLKPHLLVEAKKSDATLSSALSYLSNRLPDASPWQIVGATSRGRQVGAIRIVGIQDLHLIIAGLSISPISRQT